MKHTLSSIQSTFLPLRALAIDALLVGVALIVPTVSHLTSLPLYRLNPMLLVLLTGMVVVDERSNSLLLAVALPLVSSFVVGMPLLTKALCMSAELATLTLLYGWMQKKHTSFLAIWGQMAAAMLGAKIVYYLLKSFLVGSALADTAWSVQLFTVVGYSLLFAGITAWQRHSQDRRCGRDRC